MKFYYKCLADDLRLIDFGKQAICNKTMCARLTYLVAVWDIAKVNYVGMLLCGP